jgi:hypothetical protein
MEQEVNANVAKVETEKVKPITKVKAKKRRSIVKQNKPIGVNVFFTPNKNQFEIDKVTLSISGKKQEIQGFKTSLVDLTKLDGLNPEIAKLFSNLKLSDKHQLCFKNNLNLGINPKESMFFKGVLFGHYQRDGALSLVIRPFVSNLAELSDKHKVNIFFDARNKFYRAMVADYKPFVAFFNEALRSIG